ncbi:hypothetical protein MSAN_00841700 [Mycena sanguinolenta]|uniref:Uncharacterized protein n=1 Tax=Mycena sanguinolenta TaxID=230812 RepID=A0A8H6Z0S9_9AGAR|nr:hypothetical protein MSAN_00841700 [Mycena sanguinolenta]
MRRRRKSSRVRTARNTLQTSLIILGKIPIPGIDAAAEAVGQALTKVQEMRENATGWTDLSDRVQSVAFLASTDYEMNPELGKRLVRVLQDIGESIDAAGKYGRFRRFFNSTEDASFLTKHNSTLNEIITDITLEVCMKTNQTSAQLRQELTKFKSGLVAGAEGTEGTRGSRFLQIFTAPIKASRGTVGLRAKSGASMPHAQQNFAERIEMENGVVGIHIE